MGQTIIVVGLFIGAIAWIARRTYLQVTARKAPGCEKCHKTSDSLR